MPCRVRLKGVFWLRQAIISSGSDYDDSYLFHSVYSREGCKASPKSKNEAADDPSTSWTCIRQESEPRQAGGLAVVQAPMAGPIASPCCRARHRDKLKIIELLLATIEPKMAAEATSTQGPVKIGTRKSVLARVQTDIVCKELRKAWPDRKYEIHAMSTMGDNNQTTALHEFNAKALWTHELEALLEKGDLDLIVHSLKGRTISAPCLRS